MICSTCKTVIDDRAKFCPVCGTKLEPGVSAENAGTAADPEQGSAMPPRYPEPPRMDQYGQSSGVHGYRPGIPRRNIALCVVLSIVTCGIYMLYWLYCIVTDLNTASEETEDTGGGLVVVLSLICGIYLWYWLYKASGKVNKVRQWNGEYPDTSLGILYILLGIFGLSIVSMALIQNELNKVAVE